MYSIFPSPNITCVVSNHNKRRDIRREKGNWGKMPSSLLISCSCLEYVINILKKLKTMGFHRASQTIQRWSRWCVTPRWMCQRCDSLRSACEFKKVELLMGKQRPDHTDTFGCWKEVKYGGKTCEKQTRERKREREDDCWQVDNLDIHSVCNVYIVFSLIRMPCLLCYKTVWLGHLPCL